jgi:hypothetical protein
MTDEDKVIASAEADLQAALIPRKYQQILYEKAKVSHVPLVFH